ncbi:MAG TPA: hypothetical protein VN516_08125 [Candidatus Baltobacteraceae bacterium]|nr:hypothetical protein [Candidatus Baltobacteraceae bacterium]
MKLPTREEINVHNSLDERRACENFLGKTLDEAEGLFRENFMWFQEDLMWMGPVAFRFYVPAAIRYLQSEHSNGDSDAISCFVSLLEFRWENEPQEVRPIAAELAAALSYIVENHKKFDDEFFEIDSDLLSRCEQLIQQFQKQK